MTVTAILTCLGFPGRCGLQLFIPSGADPAAFAHRLQRARAGASCASPALLLPAILRSQGDLMPHGPWCMGAPGEFEAVPRYHYRLVHRPGTPQPLRITTWMREEERGRWRLLWGSLSLGGFLESVGRDWDTGNPA